MLQYEARPELWGRYAMVLNQQQGLLRDARLEVATPAATYEPLHFRGSNKSTHEWQSSTGGGGAAGLEGGPSAQQQQQQQQHSLAGPFMPLPHTAAQLDSRCVVWLCCLWNSCIGLV